MFPRPTRPIFTSKKEGRGSDGGTCADVLKEERERVREGSDVLRPTFVLSVHLAIA